MINNQIEAFQNRFGSYIDSEVSSGEKDNLIGTLKQMDENGASLLKEEYKWMKPQVSIQIWSKPEKAKSALLLGKKSGDVISVKFNPKTSF